MFRFLFLGLGVAIGLGFIIVGSWEGWFKPSPQHVRERIISDAERENIAFIILDASDGMTAPLLTQIRAGIAAINTHVRSGRGFDDILFYMLEYVPQRLEKKAMDLSFVRWKNGILPGYQLRRNNPDLNEANELAHKLIEAWKTNKLADLLPEGKKDQVCIVKIFYARHGRLWGALGRRLEVPESTFPELYLSDGMYEIDTDEDGAKFYCPEK